ncbi:MAG: methylenetetrahydrofolate reductase C-terminal domain-containing protein [Burkholderiales bacterium]|nr:methylenetetrahydrofolate reductase C-terminal domain-containing protein [Burkholderiales bacterium]
MKALRQWSLRHARGLADFYRGVAAHAPAAAPLVRAVGLARAEAWLRPFERAAKSAFFDCRMCGQCALSLTGLACPMGCAKQMRNGPCGGVRPDGGCEVRPTQHCTWLDATEGDATMRAGHTPSWTQRVAPLDHRRLGRSSWMNAIVGEPAPAPTNSPAGSAATRSGRAAPDAPVDRLPSGPFEQACAESNFVITVEIAPPDSPDPAPLLQRAGRFAGLVDAINITDGAGANCHMSSVAAASVLAAAGLTPVCQVGCRDRNRIAVQGDVLGAAALGVRNVLCLTGDDVSQGDHPEAKPVFDLDSVNLLNILRGMRDRGEYASGRLLERAPRLFLGATANPFVPPYAERIANLERKIDAGAQFIQTQFCFDVPLLEAFMREVRSRGLHRRAAFIVGIGTLGSAKALRWMADHVPGVHVPVALTARIGAAADQRREGIRVCVETLHALRRIEGVAGVHLMGHRNEDALAQVILESGLRSTAARQLA